MAQGTYSSKDSARGSSLVPGQYRYIPIKPVNKNRISYFYDDDVSSIHYGVSVEVVK
jgi:histone deacetylase 1/2/histone deacetylase 3